LTRVGARRAVRGCSLEIRKSLGRRALANLAGPHILAGQHHECAWELFRFGQFKGLGDEAAALELAAWARRQRIAVAFGMKVHPSQRRAEGETPTEQKGR